MTTTLETRKTGAWRFGLPGLATLAVCFGFARYGYGLFLPRFRAEFGGSAGTLGAVTSAGYLGGLAVLGIVGWSSGRLGARWPVAFGAGSAAAGMLLIGLAHGPALFVTGVVVAGMSPCWVWAPYSDVVEDEVRPAGRRHALAMISTGTAFGTAVAGVAALLVPGPGWRPVWLAAAAVAVAVTAWNLRVLPAAPRSATRGGAPATSLDSPVPARWPTVVAALRSPSQPPGHYLAAAPATRSGAPATSPDSPVPAPRPTVAAALRSRKQPPGHDLAPAPATRGGTRLFSRQGTGRLFAAATSSGLVGAACWSFAGMAGDASLLWTLIGVAGAAGLAAGVLVQRAGLRRVYVAAQLVLAAASGLFGGGFAVVAAVLYGAGFMIGGALLPLWSSALFADRPARGFSLVIVFNTVGAAIGPAAFGFVADHAGLTTAFALTSALALASIAVLPGKE